MVGAEALLPPWCTPEGRGEKEDRGCHREAGGAAPLPPHPSFVSASGSEIHYTLRQSRVGEVEGRLAGWGPEVAWVDQWLGWGWAGPISPVYFCLFSQTGGVA